MGKEEGTELGATLLRSLVQRGEAPLVSGVDNGAVPGEIDR